MSLAQHQNTCPIILRSLATEGRSTKAFLVSTVQNFPPLPPSLPPSTSRLFSISFPVEENNEWNYWTRATFEKRRDARENELFPLSASFACDGYGGRGEQRESERGGERCCYLFQRGAPGCNAREQQTPFQRREKPVCTHRVFSRVHNSLARVSYNGARISYLFSLLDQSRVVDYYRYLDISIFRLRRFEKFRKIERKREERYVDLLSFREFKNKKILLLILSKLFFFFYKIYNYGMEKSLLRCVVISKRDIIYASRIDYGNCPKISARKRRLQF